MTNPFPAIQVKNLTRRYRDLTAVEDLTFSVKQGELFGLVGPDGAGKTTTLRMLAGVLKPTAGEAIINGVSVVDDPEQVKLDSAYMPQRFGLYTDLTVLENLHFYADLYRVPEKERSLRMERLFQFSNLKPFKDRLAGQLSGGMKQKLGLSCALIHQPKILLLDEPTFGVDPISRRDLWLFIHERVAQGVTVVVSTAYMDEAERFDRVAMLYHGRILALDTPNSLRQSIEGDLFTVRVDRVRFAQEMALRHPGVKRVTLFGDQLHITVRSKETDEPAIKTLFRKGGLFASDFREISPTLEDVYIDRIAKAEKE